MAYVLLLAHAPESDRTAIAVRAREAAARGLQLDPREGRSLAALVSLEPTFGHWRQKEQRLAQARARAPEAAPLLYQHIHFLASVGRTREALRLADQLAQIVPLVPWVQPTRIELLAANGRLDEASRVAAEAGQLWPHHPQVWFARFFLEATHGSAGDALALAAEQSRWPVGQSRQK